MTNVKKNFYEKKDKSTKEQSAFSKLMSMIAGEKIKIIVGLIFAIIGTLGILAGPLILKEIGDIILYFESGTTATVMSDGDVARIWLLAIIGTVVYVLGGALQFVQGFIVSGVVARGAQKLRDKMIVKINHLPLNYFDTRNIGDVLSYISNDVDVIGTTLDLTLANVINSVVTVLGVAIIMFVLNWKIGLTAIILLPIILFVLIKVSGLSEKYFTKRSELTSTVNGFAEETYTGFNVIRVFNATKRNKDKFSGHNHELEKTINKADYYSGVSIPLMTFLGNVLFAVIAFVGGVIVVNTRKDAGTSVEDLQRISGLITTVVAAVTYANHLVQPITTIASNLATMQQAIASSIRVYHFLDEVNEPDESNKTTKIEKVEGNIEFSHVKFGYNSDRVIIHDFSEVGKHGQKIAIVGPTGAGKTTMVNLLMRFYELNSGSITIDGVKTSDMNRGYVRSLFGMVLQDTWLFEGTIMENLKYSRPTATDEEVYAACEATHCDAFIRQQPGGYNHILNEDCGLSAGQKQLLTIARAMVQNAPMLILDEATSSVDTRTEALIQDAMDKLMKGRTSFVIAHRLSTIKNSDLIIVMKDGDVIETGNHDQLMEKDGFYAKLYNSQFTGDGPQFS